MRAFEPGEAAIRLPWLAPSTKSLAALARDDSPEVWTTIRTDPAAVLLVARHLPREPEFSASVFARTEIVQSALNCLREAPKAKVDWSKPETYPVRQVALAIATAAESIARRTGSCDPICAWIAGMSAPLGWLAICAVDSLAAGECLRASLQPDRQIALQRRQWGLDASAIARRLGRNWSLPLWLQATVGHVGLPLESAIGFGADDRLFQAVQLAIILAREAGHDLGMAVDVDGDLIGSQIGLSEVERQSIAEELKSMLWPVEDQRNGDELAVDLLSLCIDKRQLAPKNVVDQLDVENDCLSDTIRTLRTGESERLRRQKLRSLAEFAAGAGHEINNPLAVISVQTQTLLAREEDKDRQDGLRKIIRQTERIHQILTDLMQFAKPPMPRRSEIDLRVIVREVIDRHRPDAEAKLLRCEWNEPASPAIAHVDSTMIRKALDGLVQNAIEASETSGFVRIELSESEDGLLIVVENSGEGPPISKREHLFDPFYSGREAGRGRGLGLSAAWRLVHENGGDVRFEPRSDCPARFVVALPAYPRIITPPPSTQDARRKTA